MIVRANQKGFVLLATLLFCFILSWVTVSLVADYFQYIKNAAIKLSWYAAVNRADFAIKNIDLEANAKASHCLIKSIPYSDLINYPANWWRTNGCLQLLAKENYYYVIEDLGIDHCALIENKSDLFAHYYRLSLILFHPDESTFKLFLQSTVIIQNPVFSTCDTNVHPVLAGRQMLRMMAG